MRSGVRGRCSFDGDRDELLQVVQNLVAERHQIWPRGRAGRCAAATARSGRRQAARGSSWRSWTTVPASPAEHIPRLTERFYRVDAPQSRDKGGTGLGLAIVKHIVSRHGGELQIASKVGKGSSFTSFCSTSFRQ